MSIELLSKALKRARKANKYLGETPVVQRLFMKLSLQEQLVVIKNEAERLNTEGFPSEDVDGLSLDILVLFQLLKTDDEDITILTMSFAKWYDSSSRPQPQDWLALCRVAIRLTK